MTEAVIVSTARTGLGKSWKGAFNMTYGATLGAHAVIVIIHPSLMRATAGESRWHRCAPFPRARVRARISRLPDPMSGVASPPSLSSTADSDGANAVAAATRLPGQRRQLAGNPPGA